VKVAIITFYAGGVPNMEVHFYTTESFSGEPRETESMVPEWHHRDKIPYGRMLASDEHWFHSSFGTRSSVRMCTMKGRRKDSWGSILFLRLLI